MNEIILQDILQLVTMTQTLKRQENIYKKELIKEMQNSYKEQMFQL